MDIAKARLRGQRLTAGRFSRPEDVVSWLGAVQAQEYADAKWALALRMRQSSESGIERALTEGRILRTHVLRPTWHFVTPADIRWMLALTGPSVSRRMAPYNRRLGLDATTFRRSQNAMVRALGGGVHLTRQELKTVLTLAGIQADGVQRLAHIVMQAELDAVICSGPRRGKQFTYAVFDERVPAAKPISREDALAQLARRYFTSHGPAQIHDFAWWAGLTIADARAGLAMVEQGLTRATIAGKTYWFESEPGAAGSAPSAHLLPLYDEYLIAYKDRSAAFDRSRWTSAPDGPFSAPVVLNVSGPVVLSGQVVGGWKRKVEKDRTVVAVTLFRRLRDSETRMIESAARAHGRFLGLDSDLSWTGPIQPAGGSGR